jgi:hypothetical protein
VQVKEFEPQSTILQFIVLTTKLLNCGDLNFQNHFMKNIQKKFVASREARDQALGWGIWTNLICSFFSCNVLDFINCENLFRYPCKKVRPASDSISLVARKARGYLFLSY